MQVKEDEQEGCYWLYALPLFFLFARSEPWFDGKVLYPQSTALSKPMSGLGRVLIWSGDGMGVIFVHPVSSLWSTGWPTSRWLLIEEVSRP